MCFLFTTTSLPYTSAVNEEVTRGLSHSLSPILKTTVMTASVVLSCLHVIGKTVSEPLHTGHTVASLSVPLSHRAGAGGRERESSHCGETPAHPIKEEE